ncbi:MAG: 3-isopropylmalate dehydratase large subunit [Bacteroidales bacterium]|nr:3-isopropylmalate dehydratase large subunit [Bacteroidales bacterium]
MKQTLIEKIINKHSKHEYVKPGDILDIEIDSRVARDFGGPSVVKHITEKGLSIDDPSKTFFTFDTNPTGSDQKYAVNQHICRQFARNRGIKVFDINNGIGTHTLINNGLSYSGTTAVTTDSHANILGAVGAFGQGMGDVDITAAWTRGKVWFKVPESVIINLNGKRPENITAKDIVLNLLNIFGANKLLGYSVEIYGEEADKLSLDERITISSMGTEMGAIILFFTPNEEILRFSSEAAGKKIELVAADADANYAEVFNIDLSTFKPRISLPGAPHHTNEIEENVKIKIDSAFVGSCTNGRMEDLRIVANILKDRKLAPGVILKIVPTTDEIWREALSEGLIEIFKNAGALVSNAGCAGCAAGQVGQNGPGEITISTGNRNFPGKQGKGEVYLASPSTVAASAVAGYITTVDKIPEKPMEFSITNQLNKLAQNKKIQQKQTEKPITAEGKAWYITQNNIDTDMIFHNRYLSITKIEEMGQYAFDNLEGYEDFAQKVQPNDILVLGKNFGSGSSRQQAVDCFKALGVSVIIAESFGSIYERNAINAAMPIMTYNSLDDILLEDGDILNVDFTTGVLINKTKNKSTKINPFYEVQLEIYQDGGLF